MSDADQRSPAAAPSNRLKFSELVQPYWFGLGVAFAAVLGETLTDLLEPWPIKVVVDNILQSKKLPNWIGGPIAHIFGQNKFATLDFAVAAVLAIAVIGATSSYLEKYMTTSVSQWVAHDLRRTLYNHIQRLSFAEYDQARTGDMITRVTSDIESVQDFIDSALLGGLVDVFTLFGMIAVMLAINWRFTLVALSVAPVLFVTVYSYTRRIKKASRAVRKKEGELLSVVEEVLTSIHVVKAFAREDYEQRRFESQSLESVETALQARSIKAKLTPFVQVIVAVGTCLVLWYGARLALAGRLSAGILIVFLLYLGKMYKPMRDLSKMTDTVCKAIVGFDRIQEVLGIESAVRDMPRAQKAPRLKGSIEFDHVDFKYDDVTPVLTDVSFQVEPGQVAAIVGASGAGKSTIISLIPRFYDPVSGCVKIDGYDVRRFKMQSLRSQISFVLQETLLFRASVWENIAYGKPDASAKEIIKAAKMADAHEFIEKMPDGYDSTIGERGATLSGGQRQRIAIARAVIRNTPILILDEPTTGLDAASENGVIEALERLMKNRTTIVISHHLSTIQRADVIFVLHDSQLAEKGRHEELIQRGGVYAELYKLQTSDTKSTPPARLSVAKKTGTR